MLLSLHGSGSDDSQNNPDGITYMAALPSNCERSPFTGKHIAYDSEGFAWRISKIGIQGWEAKPSHLKRTDDKRYAKADTLKELCSVIGKSVPTFNKV